MDQRVRFVARFREGDVTMTALCESFGISRECGYKWLRRYEEEGIDGLKEKSRAPHQQANAVAPKIVDAVLDLRRQHPTWGARKLLAWLERKHPRTAWPSASAVANWIKSHGLAAPRRRRFHAVPGATSELARFKSPNECWSTDFKGQFRTRDGLYCYPLTLQDVSTRFLVRCQALSAPTELLARPVYEAAFREHGIPAVIRSDNGTPFAAQSFSGLSVLSAWWVALGIDIERIPPGQPQHNGRIERMHRTLKAETTAPPARDIHAQQRRFNAFQVEYNTDRPHAALDNALPSTLFQPSPRRFPRMTPEPQYSDGWLHREVHPHGHVHFAGRHIQVGTPLAGYRLGFEPVDDGVWAVHFYSRRLGEFDVREATLTFPGGVRLCASNNYRPQARAQR